MTPRYRLVASAPWQRQAPPSTHGSRARPSSSRRRSATSSATTPAPPPASTTPPAPTSPARPSRSSPTPPSPPRSAPAASTPSTAPSAVAIAALLEGSGAAYLGASERSLEPLFAFDARQVELDDLPRSLRHRVAFAAITVRALAAAYPDRDPRDAEGVVLLDDLEAQQPDARALAALPARLRRALPRAQWIVSTASPQVAAGCDAGEVVALRRAAGSGQVEVHQGALAVVH